MIIKALHGIAGNGFTFQKGGEYEVSEEQGNELVKAELAIEINPPKVERAIKGKIEKSKK